MNAAVDEILGLESMDLGFIERELVKEALALAERRETFKMNKALLGPIVNAMRKLGADVTFPNSLDVRIVGDAAKLAAAVRILRTSGFTFPTESRPKKGDTSWHQFFKHSECPVAVWFNFSSSVCRRVQVGTKTETVNTPIFETVCDSIELPAADYPKALPAPPAPEIASADMPF